MSDYATLIRPTKLIFKDGLDVAIFDFQILIAPLTLTLSLRERE